jgi:hypothetical protein
MAMHFAATSHGSTDSVKFQIGGRSFGRRLAGVVFNVVGVIVPRMLRPQSSARVATSPVSGGYSTSKGPPAVSRKKSDESFRALV